MSGIDVLHSEAGRLENDAEGAGRLMGKGSSGGGGDGHAGKAAREERLAEQLRANLLKRKAQARARSAASKAPATVQKEEEGGDA